MQVYCIDKDATDIVEMKPLFTKYTAYYKT